MDDTAFHYSRTLRIIMVLAIVIPILGIGLLLWYFTSVDVPEAISPAEVEAGETAVANSTESGDDLVFVTNDGAGEGS